jgi:altronate dehydratase small subunit
MAIDAVMIKKEDNVATALRDLKAGELVSVRFEDSIRKVDIAEDISYGHKFAVQTISKGENIHKYGEVIGRATHDIAAGNHAHVHNVESLRGRGDFAQTPLAGGE